MYRKNTAGQTIGFAAVNATTGAAMTGTTGFAAFRVLDGGAQAAATGTVTDKGNGQYSFALSQADTNGNDCSILFTMTGMVPVEKTFLTTGADPTNATTFGIGNLDAAVSSRSTYAGGAVASVAAAVTLPSIPANWITAAGVASAALNGKGDWLASSGYPGNFGILSVDTTGSVKAQSNLKKNQALAAFGFTMTDGVNHAPLAGLTVTATRSLDGGSFAACANAPVGVANGDYKIDLAAADLNANVTVLRFTAPGADDLNLTLVTTP